MAQNATLENYNERDKNFSPNRENLTDNLRAEAYAPRDQVASGVKPTKQVFDALFTNLENASSIARARGPEFALNHYVAAIKIADQIDQQAVKAERLSIANTLKTAELNQEQRRELNQRDADLHTLERAPGFARANLALLMIRSGQQFQGTRLLIDAQEKDREMASDPNFIRHLNQAIDAIPAVSRPDGQVAKFTPSQPNDRLQANTSPELQSPNARLQANTSPELQTPNARLQANTSPELQTPNARLQANTSPEVQTIGDPARDVRYQRTSNQTIGAAEHLQLIAGKFKSDIQNGITAAASFESLKPAFAANINAADAEFLSAFKKVQDLEKTAGAGAPMTPQIQASLQNLESATALRFMSRFCMAACADQAGDPALAQRKLVEAFSAVPPDFQNKLLSEKEIRDVATKLGMRPENFPVAPDPLFQKILQSSEVANIASRPDAEVRSANGQPENDTVLFQQAMASMKSEGMTAATKSKFESAIKAADALFSPQEQQLTVQLMRELQTGQKADGSALTVPERVQKHLEVQQEFARAVSGMQYRMAYGSLLNQNKQYASAEKVFKENIAIADHLPLQVFQAELTQLGKDAQNPQIDRKLQTHFFNMMQNIQGSGTSRDDGLLYLPITARKQAALFYVAGAQQAGTGLVKSIEASEMIDLAKAKEKELYGVTPDKLKAFDPTLANMAQGIIPLLPENLRKQKQEADTFWSNAVIDGGTAAGVLTLAALTAAVLTKNPKIAGLLVEGGKLSTVGYGVIGTGALGTEILARHTAHKLVTGQDESWSTSAIHGTAALGSVAAMVGTRSKVSSLLYRGATAEAVTPQLVKGYGLSESATVSEFVGAMSKTTTLPESIAALAKGELASKPLIDAATGTMNAEVAQALNGYYSNAQLANMAGAVLKEGSGNLGKWYSPSGAFARARGTFSPLDFGLENRNLAGALSSRAFASGYSTAFAGIGTYNSINSLDVGIDPRTGRAMSYVDSFVRANYRSATDNTATDALYLGILPAMKDGVLARGVYAEGAGTLGKGWGYLKAPFKVSALGTMGAEGAASADYLRTGLQASTLAVGSTAYNTTNLSRLFNGLTESRALGHKLDAMATPIYDELAPNSAPLDADASRPDANNSDASRTNRQPVQEQPVQPYNQQRVQPAGGPLTQGTPGLGLD
ncbi:MAG TPA: hypothetical protein V6C89_08705 [Drouetiella sp.]|jgi:hypothetical protein